MKYCAFQQEVGKYFENHRKMGRKQFVMKTGLLSLLLLMSLSACGAAAPETEVDAAVPTPTPEPYVLTVCLGTEGHTIDPGYLEADAPDYLTHLYEGLMKYAPVTTDGVMNETRLTYGLAADVQVSEDGLTYRFRLREDALWSDGVPVGAGDFVYAWERLLTGNSPGGVQLGAVLQTVYAESDRELAVTLRQVCPWFLKLCAEVYMAPVRQDVIEAYGGDWTGEEHIVVTGPYTIGDWIHDDHITLRKNPYYYDAQYLGPETIVWYFADHTRQETFDFSADVPAEMASGSVHKSGTYYLYLNANRIPDWRIRAAMTLAIDREAIAQAIGGGATPAQGLVPQGISMTGGDAYAPDMTPMYRWLAEEYPNFDLSHYEGRCELARYLFNQAINAGTWYYSYRVYYRLNESVMNRTVAELCQKNWRDVLGLSVGLTVIEAEKYTEMLQNNTFDVAYLSWLPDYDDPASFLQMMERGGRNNHTGWGDVRYDDLLAQANQKQSREDRDRLLIRADGALFEQERFAVCPIFWFGETYHVTDGVTGIGHSAHGDYLFAYTQKR